jgi:hypothetical protein
MHLQTIAPKDSWHFHESEDLVTSLVKTLMTPSTREITLSKVLDSVGFENVKGRKVVLVKMYVY